MWAPKSTTTQNPFNIPIKTARTTQNIGATVPAQKVTTQEDKATVRRWLVVGGTEAWAFLGGGGKKEFATERGGECLVVDDKNQKNTNTEVNDRSDQR